MEYFWLRARLSDLVRRLEQGSDCDRDVFILLFGSHGGQVESHARVSRNSADGLKQKEQDSYLQCLVREVVGNSRMIQTVKGRWQMRSGSHCFHTQSKRAEIEDHTSDSCFRFLFSSLSPSIELRINYQRIN